MATIPLSRRWARSAHGSRRTRPSRSRSPPLCSATARRRSAVVARSAGRTRKVLSPDGTQRSAGNCRREKTMKSKVDKYVCKVPKGGSRKGCGGGAKVEELEKTIKGMHKRLVRVEEHHAARTRAKRAKK